MTARGKVAFKPVNRYLEPDKPRMDQSRYSTEATGDPPAVEKRWMKPKAEPSEDATGLGPVGSSGRINFFEIEVIEVDMDDDAVFIPLPKDDENKIQSQKVT